MADANTDCVFIKVDVDENEVRLHTACLLAVVCLLLLGSSMNRAQRSLRGTLRACHISLQLRYTRSTRHQLEDFGVERRRAWPLRV
jgi:hypothetical protein